MTYHDGNCDTFAGMSCSCPKSAGHKARFDGGSFEATVIVDWGRRGEVRLLVEGKTFVVRGRLADGLRSLGVDWI